MAADPGQRAAMLRVLPVIGLPVPTAPAPAAATAFAPAVAAAPLAARMVSDLDDDNPILPIDLPHGVPFVPPRPRPPFPHRPPPAGQPADELTVPIAPASPISDTMVFTDPKDATKRYRLPRYALDPTAAPVPVLFEQDGDTWSLSIDLAKSYAPEVASDTDASDISHTPAVVLRFSLLSGGSPAGQRDLSFEEVTTTDTGIRAVMRHGDAATRDQVYLALTEPVVGAALIVTRTVTAAIPVPA